MVENENADDREMNCSYLQSPIVLYTIFCILFDNINRIRIVSHLGCEMDSKRMHMNGTIRKMCFGCFNEKINFELYTAYQSDIEFKINYIIQRDMKTQLERQKQTKVVFSDDMISKIQMDVYSSKYFEISKKQKSNGILWLILQRCNQRNEACLLLNMFLLPTI